MHDAQSALPASASSPQPPGPCQNGVLPHFARLFAARVLHVGHRTTTLNHIRKTSLTAGSAGAAPVPWSQRRYLSMYARYQSRLVSSTSAMVAGRTITTAKLGVDVLRATGP